MNKNEPVKLVDLPPDTIVSYEDAHYTITAAELIERIQDDPSEADRKWYVAVSHRWQPSAKEMVRMYIENEYDNGMYEDWDDRARDCLKPEHYERIQEVLNEAFKGDHATVYWMLDGPEVIID